ncbi:hypothetical protein HPB47_025658, partial [Ixodes persulcatus]
PSTRIAERLAMPRPLHIPRACFGDLGAITQLHKGPNGASRGDRLLPATAKRIRPPPHSLATAP